MALTASQTQQCYLALGLKAEGNTRYRVRWNWFSVFDIKTTTISWDYSATKTIIDTRLGILSAAALTLLGTFIDTYYSTLTSSFEMKGEVNLSDKAENQMAKEQICKLVGIEVEEAPPEIVSRDGSGDDGGGMGRMVR